MKKSTIHIWLGVFLAQLFFSACVKDTDFDKADDILLNPVVDLDLVYFDLPANRFFDTVANTPILAVKDTTALPFLNDSEVRGNVKRIVFSFEIENNIQREFQLDFEFLNRGNNVVYTSQIIVVSGTIENPTVIEYIDTVEGQDLSNLTKAERLAVSVAIESSNQNLNGNINLQSIATYYIEF